MGFTSIIEKSYPHLDQNLLEFLTTIPLNQLLRNGNRRFLMRRALANILPPEILARKTKSTCSRCYSLTLEKHWKRVEGLVSSPLSSRLGYVETKQMREAFIALKNGQAPSDILRLLNALSLELWLRQPEILSMISRHTSMPLTTRAQLVDSRVHSQVVE